MSLGEEEGAHADCCPLYKFTKDDVDAVNVTSWLDGYKHLCPKTISLPVPPEVLKYLKSDGMVMPQNTHTTAHLNSTSSRKGKNEEEDDDNVSWASLSDMEEPCMPSEFLQKIRRQQEGPGGKKGGHGERVDGDDFGDDSKWQRQSNSSSSSDEDDDPSGHKKSMEVEKFHEFDSLLDMSIKELGGAVLPKINRKSPKVSC